MEKYRDSFIKTVKKVFDIPKIHSKEYVDINSEILTTLNKINNGDMTHEESIDFLQKFLSTFKRLPEKQARSYERVSLIDDMLKLRNITPKRVLDIGAGDGKITKSIKEYYNLSKENVFAIDNKSINIPEITTLTYDNGKIPIEDNSIDLIIIFMVLHHVTEKERSSIISEANRVLSEDGVIIIREHDNDKTKEFHTFIDFIHIFWYLVSDETDDPLYLFTNKELKRLFDEHGLNSIKNVSYNHYNPQRIYHEMFGKKVTPIGYNFENEKVSNYLKEYINNFRKSYPSYKSFILLTPKFIIKDLFVKYEKEITEDIFSVWDKIAEDIVIAIILEASKKSLLVNGVSIIKLEILENVISG